MKIKIFFCVLVLTLFIFNISFAVEYKDVSKEHWAHEYIDKLSNDGIINGFEDGSFRPSETLTKAQFIKLMVSSDKLLLKRMNDLLGDYSIDKQWYESYFDVAEEYYLLPDGYEKNYLNSPITRKDMAEILSNFIKFVSVYNSLNADGQTKLKENLDEEPEYINNAFSEYLISIDSQLKNSFTDVLELDKKSQENIFIVKDLKIINGYEDGTFKPYNYVTRAEASKVLSKYIDEAGIGIIISNMIHNKTDDIISDTMNQMEALDIQIFNSRFEQYEGIKKNKTITKSLVTTILASNNDFEHKISIELIDSKGQSILDYVSIRNTISNFINGTNFDILFEKDTKGYINKAIIKANTPINDAESSLTNNENSTQSDSLDLNISSNNVLRNNKNEVIKYINNMEFNEFSTTNITKEQLVGILGEENYAEQIHIEFRTIPFNNFYPFDIPEDADYILLASSFMKKIPLDFYKLSNDNKSLISLKRGADYNLKKESNSFSFNDYVSEAFDINSNLSGVFKTNDDEVMILKDKNANRIIYTSKKDYFMNSYYLFAIDKENLISYSYPLEIYFKNNDILKVKDIYQLPNYANYFTGLIEYKDGKVEWLSVNFTNKLVDNKPEVEVKKKEEHIKIQKLTLDIIDEYKRGISTAE